MLTVLNSLNFKQASINFIVENHGYVGHFWVCKNTFKDISSFISCKWVLSVMLLMQCPKVNKYLALLVFI